MFGVLIGANYIHRPVLDRQTRGLMGQLVALVVLNLIIGVAMVGVIDNWAHIGGLITGLWLGVLVAPSRVPTLRSMWLRPGPTPGTTVPVFGGDGDRGDPCRRDRGAWRVLRRALGHGLRGLGLTARYDPLPCSRCCPARGRG